MRTFVRGIGFLFLGSGIGFLIYGAAYNGERADPILIGMVFVTVGAFLSFNRLGR